MKSWLSLILIPLLFGSCEKGVKTTKSTCFKGRYIAKGCWTVIQLLEPLDASLPTSPYGQYENAFGSGDLPDKFKDGQPFYFTVNHVDSNMTVLDYCTPTKYSAAIDNLSATPCSQLEN